MNMLDSLARCLKDLAQWVHENSATEAETKRHIKEEIASKRVAIKAHEAGLQDETTSESAKEILARWIAELNAESALLRYVSKCL